MELEDKNERLRKDGRRVRSILHTRQVHAKSYGYITCPFCGGEVKVYWWLLAGCGKKCTCKAMLGNFGLAWKDLGW